MEHSQKLYVRGVIASGKTFLKVSCAVLALVAAACVIVTYQYSPLDAETIAAASSDACVKMQLSDLLGKNEYIDRTNLQQAQATCAKAEIDVAVQVGQQKIIDRQKAALQ